MNQHFNAISNRLSLHHPQRESLEILAHICDIISLDKGADAADALKTLQSEFANVTDFERDFPSLCFALATGVGKTRLMGAFIAYLSRAEGVRNYFVLAPNLTIYNKLIADFTPGSPKYVLQGLAEFATNASLKQEHHRIHNRRGHTVRLRHLVPKGANPRCDRFPVVGRHKVRLVSSLKATALTI